MGERKWKNPCRYRVTSVTGFMADRVAVGQEMVDEKRHTKADPTTSWLLKNFKTMEDSIIEAEYVGPYEAVAVDS